jgi:ElaB/YqjD/DUF883 family membrane-anchored ribosome-binding protein
MPEHSSVHAYLNWTKQRLDEMDAVLASLESKAGQAQAESKIKAEQLVADLKKRRDEFQAMAEKQAKAGEATLQHAQAQLETQWDSFEDRLKAYFEAAGKHIDQQQATFREMAAAQLKSWREAAAKFHEEASKLAAAKRAEFDIAIQQMKADAANTEARLKQAGKESGAALNTALAESRKAFDRANQEAWDAFKRAASPKA